MAEADCDRFIVTDNPDISVDGATTIVDDMMNLPPAIASRRYKLCPQGPLSDYDLTIYLDNRSALKPNAIQRLKEVEAPFSLFRHHQRDCVYREGKACRRNKVIDKKRLDRQIARYRQAGLPRNSGLFCGTFLVRKRIEGQLADFTHAWVEHFLHYSERDQISLGYLAWRQKYEFGILDGNLADNPFMRWPVISKTERAAFRASVENHAPATPPG
jgi:hypothetical protein